MLSVDRFAQEFAIVRAGRIVDIAVVATKIGIFRYRETTCLPGGGQSTKA